MAPRLNAINRHLNGLIVYQRQLDGYVNATQISKIHRDFSGERRDPSDWLRTETANRAIAKLSSVTGIPVTDLVEIKQGGKYQGTWIHPKLVVRFAMWVNDDFSLQVEDWVHEWLSSANNPIRLEADIDRVAIRDELKDVRRPALGAQVKMFLEAAGQYDPKSSETRIFFGRVHNELNIVLTGEKADQMRLRLEVSLNKKVNESELLRDYFPIIDLANYAAVCQAATNNMEQGMHPINAIRLAAKQVLPSSYVPKIIDFTERIALVRLRIEQANQINLLSN
jgi:hypothetical protein